MASCLIVAGEKSGEEHALSFMEELMGQVPDIEFFGVGGDDLRNKGVELLYHLKDFSSMGFSEVIQKIPFYLKALNHLEHESVAREVKTAILIDFQDFNMRLARRLKKRGIKVLYYVAPQAWAWKAQRAKVLAENVHTLFTILPFEKNWFKSRGVTQVMSIPHPLLKKFQEEIKNIPERTFGCWNKKMKLLLLPGSRVFEVKFLLPIFIEVIKILKKSLPIEVHLVKVGHIRDDFYRIFEQDIDVWYSSDEIAQAAKQCHFCLAASGTVTLCTGLFELPTIVCYKGGLLNEFIFNNFIKYKGPISLTNIVHQEMIFPEFIQHDVTPHHLVRIIKTWSEDEKVYNNMKNSLKQTKNLLAPDEFSVPEYMAHVMSGLHD